MQIITRSVLLASFVAFVGLGVAETADARAYIKQLESSTQPTRPAMEDRQTANGGGEDDTVVVPEPATLALLGAGLASLGLAKRRQKKNSAE